LPIVAAWSSILVLTASLIGSKYLLDAVVDFGWPVAAYVALLAAVGYGPSLWWCRYVSRRWGTGRLGPDIGLTPRWSDLGWGPLVWLGAIAAQIAVGVVVLAFEIPVASNTEGISEISADRTYVWALVISAVIAAPLVEEMVFRGVVMRGLRSRLPVVVAVILQGVLFGAAHADPVRGVGNVGLVLVLSGVGIAFGVAATLLRRIGPSIVAHAIFNGAVLALLLTGVAERLQEDASVVEEIGVVDQAHVTQTGGNGDPGPADSTVGAVERIERGERLAVEHRDVVERCQRFVGDHTSGGVSHLDRRGVLG
jgi:membrane protease YdiL (CAAX protease family)